MIRQGHTHCHYDKCMYFQQFGKSFVYLLVCIDDMIIASKGKSVINKLKSRLNIELKMKDLGAGKKILVMQIDKDCSPVSSAYLKEVS